MKKHLRLLTFLFVAVLMLCALASCTPAQPTTTTKKNEIYFITYELNGGENNPNNPEVYIGSQQLYKPTRPGYIFEGWYDNASFEGEAYTRVKNLTSDICFYAKWEVATFNIIYELGNENAVNNNQNDTGFNPGSGKEILLLDAACPGYKFEGWYTTADFQANSRVERMQAPEALADITLYAKWSENKGMTEPIAVIPDHLEDNYGSDSLLLKDMETSTGLLWYAGDRTKPIQFYQKENGEKVLYWTDPPTQQQLALTGLDNIAFSEYTHLEFWMYSGNANGATFGLVFWGPDVNGDGKGDYRAHNITLNWSGWKKISIQLTDTDFSNGLALDDIQDMRFMTSGWVFDIENFDNSLIYVDDMYLTNQASPYQPDTSTFNEAQMTQVKDRWRELLVGNETLNASSAAQSKAASISKTGKDFADSMNMAADRTYLWSSLKNLTTEVGVYNNYTRINAMAKAWGTIGSSCYHDADLLEKIISALTFMNEFDANGDGIPGCYGDNVTIQGGQPGNWWHWDIGTPMELVDILIIIENEVDDEFIAKMLAPLDYCIPNVEKTVANRTWVAYGVMGSALLQNKTDKYVKAIQDTLDVFQYVTEGDGFYADGSFIQHNKLSYINGYGSSFFSTLTFELYTICGTDFDVVMREDKTFSNIYVENLFKFFFDSYVPFVYNGTTVYTTSGRGMSVGGINGQISNLLRIVGYAEEQTQTDFYALMKYFGEVNSTYANLTDSMSFVTLPLYEAYKAKINEIEARSDYYFNHVYAGMDRVMTYTPTYAAVLAMSSERIYRYEAINNEGGTGWYLGDGALFLFGEDASQYNGTYVKALDKMMVPGTTVSTTQREALIYSVDSNLLNHSHFVGGVSNGLYGVSAMVLKYAATDKMGAYISDLTAQKAYFFFDNEIVCVGSSISASNETIVSLNDTRLYNTGEIYTVLENHFGISNLKVNGTAAGYDAAGMVHENVSYFTIGDYNGYYFPNSNKADVTVRLKDNNVQAFINHGEAPENEGYLYVILPGANDAETGAYAANSDVEVLLDSNIVTAVREKTLGITGYVFWYGSYYDGIRASEACIGMKTENADGSYTYNFSDPTQMLSSFTVTLDGEWNIEGAPSTIEGGKTVITVVCAGEMGATLNFTATAK